MQLTRLGNVELYRPESAALLSFVSTVTSAFDSRMLHRKGATCARGGVLKFIHVVNNDTIMHAVLCIPAQLPSEHSPDQV